MTKVTELLHDMGQSLWLDNITRGLLDSGTLEKYISDLSVTGLTSNPTIFDHAIKNTNFYDSAIAQKVKDNKAGEALFFEIAIEDLGRAADIFKPIHERSNGVDGWVSLEVSPKLAYDTASTLAAAKQLPCPGRSPESVYQNSRNREGLPAIEEAIFAGVPVNVTLLFSREHYLAPAEAYLRGVERRIEAGLNPRVESVASVLCQPVGWRRRGQNAGRPDQQIGDPHGRANIQGVPRFAHFRSLDAPRQLWRAHPSASCGQAQAPKTQRRWTISMSGRSRHQIPSTRCPKPPC